MIQYQIGALPSAVNYYVKITSVLEQRILTIEFDAVNEFINDIRANNVEIISR